MKGWVQAGRVLASGLLLGVLAGCGGGGGSASSTPPPVRELQDPPSAVWTTAESGWLQGVASDRVFLFDGYSQLTAVALATGEKLWSNEVPGGPCSVGDSVVVCLDVLARQAQVLDASTGTLETTVDLGDDPTGDLAIDDLGFYTRHGVQAGESGPQTLKAWDLNGAPRWSVSGPTGAQAEPYSEVNAAGGFVAVSVYLNADGAGVDWKAVYDAVDGREVAAGAVLTETGQVIHIQDSTTEILDATGTVIRAVPGFPARDGLPLDPAGTVVSSLQDGETGKVLATASGGTELWTAPLDEWTRVTACDSHVVAAGHASVARIDPATGHQTWRRASPVSSPVVRCVGPHFLLTPAQVEGNDEATATMVALDAATGEERWFVPAIGEGILTHAGLLIFDPMADRVRLYR